MTTSINRFKWYFPCCSETPALRAACFLARTLPYLGGYTWESFKPAAPLLSSIKYRMKFEFQRSCNYQRMMICFHCTDDLFRSIVLMLMKKNSAHGTCLLPVSLFIVCFTMGVLVLALRFASLARNRLEGFFTIDGKAGLCKERGRVEWQGCSDQEWGQEPIEITYIYISRISLIMIDLANSDHLFDWFS